MLTPLSLALLAIAPLPRLGPHGGLMTTAGAGVLELVVGPERLALYPLDSSLSPLPLEPRDQVSLLCLDHPALPLLAATDHFEASNPYGVEKPLTFAAILQRRDSVLAARFAFDPTEASTFHDHRPYHGGMLGMVGERHLELALVPLGRGGGASAESELQLYVTDAYRRPIPLAGLSALVQIGEGRAVPLLAAAGSFVTRLPRSKEPLDVHTEVRFPGEPEPVSMDFYLEQQPAPAQASTGRIEVRVSGGGFTPARIETSAGAPLKLRFLRVSKETCGKQVVFPALGLTRDLPLRQPVDIDLVAPRGELAFTCGMHMFKGSIVGQ